ncbi:hypothetical protein OBBRIDRAFT_298193 [Obba rivulosa]|uniref:Uncharacterized protein n=1 Tax=Obba rivulosa TaxID=1052685 RepID=A0A8E2AJY2_9APHY|nr:hypothetical protein OBBRIDRAFT_298193 [Obba rivulosa]
MKGQMRAAERAQTEAQIEFTGWSGFSPCRRAFPRSDARISPFVLCTPIKIALHHYVRQGPRCPGSVFRHQPGPASKNMLICLKHPAHLRWLSMPIQRFPECGRSRATYPLSLSLVLRGIKKEQNQACDLRYNSWFETMNLTVHSLCRNPREIIGSADGCTWCRTDTSEIRACGVGRTYAMTWLFVPFNGLDSQYDLGRTWICLGLLKKK